MALKDENTGYDIRAAIREVLTRDPDKPIDYMLIDGCGATFNSMEEVDAFRKLYPEHNGQLLTNDGYPINENNLRLSERGE